MLSDFVESMFIGVLLSVGGVVVVIGFLFFDEKNYLFGVNFIVVMVDEIDCIECDLLSM